MKKKGWFRLRALRAASKEDEQSDPSTPFNFEAFIARMRVKTKMIVPQPHSAKWAFAGIAAAVLIVTIYISTLKRPPEAYGLLLSSIAQQFQVDSVKVEYDDTPRGENQILVTIKPHLEYDSGKDRELADAVGAWLQKLPEQTQQDMHILGTDQADVILIGPTRARNDIPDGYWYDLKRAK